MHWFRNDLRLDDHSVLNRAAEVADELVGIYIFDETLFEQGIHGGSRMHSRRAFFQWQSVMELRENMRNRGSDLYVFKGNSLQVLQELHKTWKFSSLSYSKGVGEEERMLESTIEKAFDSKLETHSDWTHTLIDLNNLPFSIESSPDVFTPFRKKIEKYHEYLPPLEAPSILPTFTGEIPSNALNYFEELELQDFETDERAPISFKGGELAARARIEHYFWESKALLEYKETRNGLIGADYSSKLSPWLANGSLSPRRVHSEVKRFESENKSNESTYWLIFELLWRDFFQIVALKHKSKLFAQNGWKGESRKWRTDKALFEKWTSGETEDDFVNANMKELKLTGFMSNRGRQNVASFLTHQYKIDWRWGASYFEEMLIDYDVASNWGNWSYVSGTGNDPRKDRVFNTELQAEKYDPQRKYRDLWLD